MIMMSVVLLVGRIFISLNADINITGELSTLVLINMIIISTN